MQNVTFGPDVEDICGPSSWWRCCREINAKSLVTLNLSWTSVCMWGWKHECIFAHMKLKNQQLQDIVFARLLSFFVSSFRFSPAGVRQRIHGFMVFGFTLLSLSLGFSTCLPRSFGSYRLQYEKLKRCWIRSYFFFLQNNKNSRWRHR